MMNTQPLVIVGDADADAASCIGDYCEIPEHHQQAVVNRAIDSDRI